MDGDKRVWLNSAGARAWTVAGLALAAAVWHGWAITVTPERPTFWVMVFADVLVVAVAGLLGTWWPRTAVFGADELVLGKSRIRYDTITTTRFGHVSAKPFWLAFWLPQSLLIGGLLALRRSDAFDRKVVEIDTPGERYRLRWRHQHPYEEFTEALRAARPDLDAVYGLDGRDRALDLAPKLSIGGGFLALGLSVWALCTVLFGIELLDRSTIQPPQPGDVVSAPIRSLTARSTGYPDVGAVPFEITTTGCERENDVFLGRSPEVVSIALDVRAAVPAQVQEEFEDLLRSGTGMSGYIGRLDGNSEVQVNVPEDDRLSFRFTTSCVDVADEARLRDDLRALATALGLGR
ncbi:hypothetical protein ABZ816_01605 [Actinosynnema sp. NPDC047251]|uniref:hypothetical protein n=1 Tax=Saccharothrix espanaensis TaxID=103731 RepID=UPI00030F6722|nr:hypothetical protein [Saccharothrix espanaensis]